MPFDEVEEAEDVNSSGDDVKEDFLTATWAEMSILKEYPYKHDYPMDTNDHKEPVRKASGEQCERHNSGTDDAQTPEKHNK